MSIATLRVAIVGGATLKGKELADVLTERSFPASDVRLLDDDEALGQLGTMGDEVTFVQSVSPEQFRNVDMAFFASDEVFTRRHWRLGQDSGAAIIDLSYGLESEAGVVVRAPWIERELGRPQTPELQPAPLIVAHPAAVILSLLLLRLQRVGPIAAAAATVIEPASERGRRGMDELHEQTVNLLSFRELPKDVFKAQVAFNMLSAYGEGAEPELSAIGNRISRHFDHIVSGIAPAPALLVLQGPSFHGHTLGLYAEMQRRAVLEDVLHCLGGEHVAVVHGAAESPSNVNSAGQNEILLAVRPDHRRENGLWLWAAADNLRLTALNAVECAESVAAARPRGKVQ